MLIVPLVMLVVSTPRLPTVSLLFTFKVVPLRIMMSVESPMALPPLRVTLPSSTVSRLPLVKVLVPLRVRLPAPLLVMPALSTMLLAMVSAPAVLFWWIMSSPSGAVVEP